MTTTGFSSADFQAWSPFAQLLLLVLMFVGGCTGSTAGGMKVTRIGVLFRVVGREFRQLVEPRGVFAVRFGGRAIPEKTIRSLLNLVYLAFLVNFVACMCLAALGMDVLTTISAVAACMFIHRPRIGTGRPRRKLRRTSGGGKMGPEHLHARRPPRVLHAPGALHAALLEDVIHARRW